MARNLEFRRHPMPKLLIIVLVCAAALSPARADVLQETNHVKAAGTLSCHDRGVLQMMLKQHAKRAEWESWHCELLDPAQSFEVEYTAEGFAEIAILNARGNISHSYVAAGAIAKDKVLRLRPEDFGHPPILKVEPNPDVPGGTVTTYDVCYVKDGEPPRIKAGCPFDPDKIGARRGEFVIHELPAGAERLVIDALSGRWAICDAPIERVFGAYSPYQEGVLLAVRGGVLFASLPIDRVRLRDYMDPALQWEPWQAGWDAKGFLTCAERSAKAAPASSH
jgi:hypothetical protein